MSIEEYEKKYLSLSLAGKVSGEDEEHKPGDAEYQAMLSYGLPPRSMCRCDRCRIIRIKKRKALRFPRSKCKRCGKLFVQVLHETCESCRNC